MGDGRRVWDRRRGNPVYMEKLVNRLEKRFFSDVEFLYNVLAPEGRLPFEVKLTPTERLERIMQATPADWDRERGRLEAIPDERERGKALGQLFAEWASMMADKEATGGSGENA